MNKSNFDRLLERYVKGQVSDREKKKLEAWLDMLAEEDTKDLELTPAQERELFDKITSRIDSSSKERTLNRPFPFSKKVFLQVAASVVILILAGVVLWYWSSSHGKVFVATKAKEKFILSDGTIVWLEKDSKVIFNNNIDRGVRQCQLVGAALFEVTKDASRPFVISLEQGEVRVLGTSFFLSARRDSLELNVLTGKVSVTGYGAANEVVHNQRGVLLTSGKSDRKALSREEIQKITDGTEYAMAFQDKTLEEIMERIEAKFDVSIDYKKPDSKFCRLTADFTDQSLETTLALVEEVLEVKFIRNGKEIILEGKGCR